LEKFYVELIHYLLNLNCLKSVSFYFLKKSLVEIKITIAIAKSENNIVKTGKVKLISLSNLKPPNTPNRKTANIWNARLEYFA